MKTYHHYYELLQNHPRVGLFLVKLMVLLLILAFFAIKRCMRNKTADLLQDYKKTRTLYFSLEGFAGNQNW